MAFHRNPDWIEFNGFEFALLGSEGSSIHFVAERVLASRVLLTGVVSFNVRLVLKTPDSVSQHSFSFTAYNGLRPFRDGLSDIRSGAVRSVTMAEGGFSMTVGFHLVGLREGLVVQGRYSSVTDSSEPTWPSRVRDVVLLDSSSAACVYFAFPTSLVDPPHIDNAIRQLDEILDALENRGYQP